MISGGSSLSNVERRSIFSSRETGCRVGDCGRVPFRVLVSLGEPVPMPLRPLRGVTADTVIAVVSNSPLQDLRLSETAAGEAVTVSG